jgi:hypothetical protein
MVPPPGSRRFCRNLIKTVKNGAREELFQKVLKKEVVAGFDRYAHP